MDENIPSEASAEQPVSDSVSDPVLSSSAPTLATRIRHILELIRFSHTIFALPFAGYLHFHSQLLLQFNRRTMPLRTTSR